MSLWFIEGRNNERVNNDLMEYIIIVFVINSKKRLERGLSQWFENLIANIGTQRNAL